jgi:hypothetical protein
LSSKEKSALPAHILSIVQKQEAAINHAIGLIEATKCIAFLRSKSDTYKAASCDSHEQEFDIRSEKKLNTSNQKALVKDCDQLWQTLFEWAWFTVNTRAVYLAADPRESQSSKNSWGSDKWQAEDSLALAPFLDLLNHSGDVTVQAGINIYPCKHRQDFSNNRL